MSEAQQQGAGIQQVTSYAALAAELYKQRAEKEAETKRLDEQLKVLEREAQREELRKREIELRALGPRQSCCVWLFSHVDPRLLRFMATSLVVLTFVGVLAAVWFIAGHTKEVASGIATKIADDVYFTCKNNTANEWWDKHTECRCEPEEPRPVLSHGCPNITHPNLECFGHHCKNTGAAFWVDYVFPAISSIIRDVFNYCIAYARTLDAHTLAAIATCVAGAGALLKKLGLSDNWIFASKLWAVYTRYKANSELVRAGYVTNAANYAHGALWEYRQQQQQQQPVTQQQTAAAAAPFLKQWPPQLQHQQIEGSTAYTPAVPDTMLQPSAPTRRSVHFPTLELRPEGPIL